MNKRHIKVSQERLLCPTHDDNKNKQVFEKKCKQLFAKKERLLISVSTKFLNYIYWVTWLPNEDAMKATRQDMFTMDGLYRGHTAT